jgi:hypothetical protein
MRLIIFFLLFTIISESTSLTSVGTRQSRGSNVKSTRRNKTKLKSKTVRGDSDNEHQKRCKLCPDPPLNEDLDRREALFSLIGQVAAGLGTLFWAPKDSNAVYGADAKLEIPNVMDGINNRASGRQCLVESLGNRECLAYLDPDNKLWQNPDSGILLDRLQKAIAAFTEVPELVSSKKWSKISGILTGPMGTLSDTMNMLAKMSGDSMDLKSQTKTIKTTLYEINAAVERKEAEKILKLHEKATKDLIVYSQSLN